MTRGWARGGALGVWRSRQYVPVEILECRGERSIAVAVSGFVRRRWGGGGGGEGGGGVAAAQCEMAMDRSMEQRLIALFRSGEPVSVEGVE